MVYCKSGQDHFPVGPSTTWGQNAQSCTASKLLQTVTTGDLANFAGCRDALNECKRPTYQQTKMSTFLHWLAICTAAGSFGVAVVQTAMTEPLQQHSGTQPYVRVVR